LAQYVHNKGLKFGVYTDRGNETCGGRPGSLHHEKIDALTYAKWGVDYLKEDSCYATQDHAAAFAEYGAMRDALNATGRPIFFSLCGWNDWYAPVGYGLGNSWRIGPDDQQWENVINNVNIDVKLSKYAGPGGWNDPCLLLGDRLSYEQAKTQFSLWSVLAAPLLISANIRNMTDQFLNIYKNQEVIAVNQDPAGKQGFRVAGQALDINANISINVIARPLHTGSWAAVFVNVGKSTSDIVCKSTCLKMMGFSSKDQIKVRDLWTHKDEKTIQGSYTAHSVMGGGSSKMALFTRVK
jgi:alpha-galactosidase